MLDKPGMPEKLLRACLWDRYDLGVIEYAQNVFFRDDLGEKTKEHAVRSFQMNIAEGRMLIAARVAAAHLPVDIGVCDNVSG